MEHAEQHGVYSAACSQSIIVDEVWLYTSIPPAARFFESVARMGRKRNVAFILNTRRAVDVLEGGGGRALLENCAAKVLLRRDESAVGTIGKAFALSESESRRRSKLPAGAPHSRERSCASRVPRNKGGAHVIHNEAVRDRHCEMNPWGEEIIRP